VRIISRALGYEPHGFGWATQQGEPAQLNRWRLTWESWEPRRHHDVELHGVEACRTMLPLV
jgi:hypothetical protein